MVKKGMKRDQEKVIQDVNKYCMDTVVKMGGYRKKFLPLIIIQRWAR